MRPPHPAWQTAHKDGGIRFAFPLYAGILAGILAKTPIEQKFFGSFFQKRTAF
jgi:hypothetical protein